MKNIIFIFVFIMTIMSCSKEISNSENEKKIASSRSNEPNFLEFETFLNDTFVPNQSTFYQPVVYSIPFSHTSGYISQSEKNSIIQAVSQNISENSSVNIIDVNIKDSKIEIYRETGGPIPDFLSNGIEPDGGLGFIGHYCGGALDELNGGCGRTCRKFFKTLPPVNVGDRFNDIRNFSIVGSCNFNITDDWKFEGLIEIEQPTFWHYEQGCPSNGVVCMQQNDIQGQLNVILSTISNYLPPPYSVIGIKVGRRDIFQDHPLLDFGF